MRPQEAGGVNPGAQEAGARHVDELASTRLEQLCSFLNPLASVDIYTGKLPHWRQEGVSYFVTFRLADSLPFEKLAAWSVERQEWLRQHPEPLSGLGRREFIRLFPARLEQWLDQGSGSCVLRLPECRIMVEEALRFFDGERYLLGEYVVAPNHVHVVVKPKDGHELNAILHSWKSFTAKRILKVERAVELLAPFWGREEERAATTPPKAVWQKESYDHIIRGPESPERIIAYIRGHRVSSGELSWLEDSE